MYRLTYNFNDQGLAIFRILSLKNSTKTTLVKIGE